jgi:hypothetical protein
MLQKRNVTLNAVFIIIFLFGFFSLNFTLQHIVYDNIGYDEIVLQK